MSKHAALDWYQTPLYYDIVFSDEDRREGDFLAGLVERFGPPARGPRRVLEPACGSGRMLVEMARRGFEVCGFDASAQMIEFARKRLSRARREGVLFEGRLENFQAPGRFDLAHCLVNTFKYLPDEDSVQSHLRCVARALRPGGLYVIGIHLTEYEDRRCNHERWNRSRDGVQVVCNIRGWPADPRTRSEQVRSRLVVRQNGEEKRTETRWQFRTYDWNQLRRTLSRAAAFEHLGTYDFTYDLALPREMPDDHLDVVVVLRKRTAARASS